MRPIAAKIMVAMNHLNVDRGVRMVGITEAQVRTYRLARVSVIAVAEQAAGQEESGLLTVLDQLRTA